MSPELTILTLTAVLAATLWMPYIIISSRPGNAEHQTFDRMTPVWNMTDVAQRAYRAHQNMVEQFGPFAVVVLVAHVAGISTTLTVWAAVAFLIVRCLHAVGFIAGWAQMPMRPILFTAGWLCILTIAGAVLLG